MNLWSHANLYKNTIYRYHFVHLVSDCHSDYSKFNNLPIPKGSTLPTENKQRLCVTECLPELSKVAFITSCIEFMVFWNAM